MSRSKSVQGTGIETRTALPCPHCGVDIPMTLWSYAPTRRSRFCCRGCGGESILPVRAVLVGLAVMLPAMAVLLAICKELGWMTAESGPGMLSKALSFALFSLGGMSIGAWACRVFADRLVGRPR